DDTLSALDVHTEAVVEEALRRVLHEVTGVVVAHRASTVLLADPGVQTERQVVDELRGSHLDGLTELVVRRVLATEPQILRHR
ncbi:hypothetical protein C6A85_15775, partial [Mycobacterium sp. ITM-2017-0098]